jgi:hypothetical protein
VNLLGQPPTAALLKAGGWNQGVEQGEYHNNTAAIPAISDPYQLLLEAVMLEQSL